MLSNCVIAGDIGYPSAALFIHCRSFQMLVLVQLCSSKQHFNWCNMSQRRPAVVKLLVITVCQISLRTDDLIDELPVEKRHLSKLIIICRISCRIKLRGD